MRYGTDLKLESERERVKEMIRVEEPRLVIVEYPCTLWSKLSNLNYIGPQERRRLLKKRKAERPFWNCVEISLRYSSGEAMMP